MSTTAHWLRIKELFRLVQQQPEPARVAWLARECAGDEELFEEVRGLLQAQGEAPGILGGDAVDVLRRLRSDDSEPDFVGQRIGAYRVLRLIGQGGMGRVFLAERDDGDFTQRVALKLVRSEFINAETRARFLRERNFLARLAHPHIAQLHDGGVGSDGTPYFTLEYVEGDPITRYSDTHALGIRERVALILQVCAAVTFAHRNLIVHRDLKPSNILVTSDGEVKLLDFGIAKLLDVEGAEGQTVTQARMMTPEYAAPEQVLGEPITTATDVYSIGVLLYELLSGRLPYARADSGSISWAKAVVEESPESLNRALGRDTGKPGRLTAESAAATRGTNLIALRRSLRGDLERVVSRALAKEPEARYASVSALADDLRAYLNGRAVSGSARRYRMNKFVSRNWLPLSVASLLLVVLIGAVFVVAQQVQRTAREADKTTAVKDFLLELFRNADPNVAQGRQISLRSLVDRGSQRLDTIPPQQVELKAELQNTLGTIYYQLGLFKEATGLHRQAFSLVKDDRDQSQMAANSERLVATDLAGSGDNDEAQRLADEAVQRLRSVRPLPAHELARALSTAGWIAKKRADLPRTKELSDEALKLANQPPIDEELMCLALRLKGESARLQNDSSSAVTYFTKALAISEHRFGAEDEETIVLERLVGTTLNVMSEFAKAQPYLDSAYNSSRRVFGDSSGRTLRDFEMVAVNENDAGHTKEAGVHMAQMLKLAEQANPRDDSVLTEIRLNYGELNIDYGSARDAEAQLVLVRDYLLEHKGDEGELAEALNGLGGAQLRLGKFAEAEQALRDSLARLASGGIDDTAPILSRLSQAKIGEGDISGAVELGEQAVDKAVRVDGEKSHTAAAAHYSHGEALIAAKRTADAINEWRAALNDYVLLNPPAGMDPLSSTVRLALGEQLVLQPGTRDEGVRLLTESVALMQKYFPADDERTSSARAALRKATANTSS